MSPATSRARARAWRAIVATAAAAGMSLAAGCEVGPDFQRPAAPEAKGFSPQPSPPATTASDIPGGEAQSFIQGQDIPGQWWTLFHSKPLDALIEQALKANPSLQAAQAALRQARENVYAGQGALFPSVTANASATREKISGASFGLPGLSSAVGITSIGLNLSYTLDVFGGVRRQVESLEAREEYERFQLEATYLTLTSNVALAAVEEASLRAQIAATEDIIGYETQELKVLQSQFELGGISKAAVLQQAATLAQERATLPALQKLLSQQRDLLTALAGKFPSEELEEKFDLSMMRLPPNLPLSLPSQLVEQRPDIRAAEAQLHEASADIGVATANQLPQFSITGSYGSTSLGFNNLISPGTGVWSIGGAVAQTIFDAGTLLHKKRAAVAAFDEASAQYRSAVLTAFQNVADALRALESDADALKAQVAAERAAADSLALSEQQYKAGAITYLLLLTAEQTYQQTRISLVQAQAARYADTATLFQALGGGWWNRADAAGDDPGPERFWLPPLPIGND
jgi:NodT family efflux transporter outer membrane factor (OMF) lipoprotein